VICDLIDNIRITQTHRRPSAPNRRLEVMLTLGYPVIGVADMSRAVAFWTAALDLVDSDEWCSDAWRTLHHANGSGRALGLQRSESPVEAHPRMHLDLFVDTSAEQEAEVKRLIGLGASRLDWDMYPPEPDFVVLADPDGNVFCVVDLSRAPSGDHQ
jgi:catechol 2,3-dioxygenase-like lactoylglutathione lyase family enzyme